MTPGKITVKEARRQPAQRQIALFCEAKGIDSDLEGGKA